jgi:hypothetical protein
MTELNARLKWDQQVGETLEIECDDLLTVALRKACHPPRTRGCDTHPGVYIFLSHDSRHTVTVLP